MPLISGYKEYQVSLLYVVDAETEVGGHTFTLNFDDKFSTEDPAEALERAKSLNQHEGITLKLSRRITFDRKDGYISDLDHIDENLDIDKLERIIGGEDDIPSPTYETYVDPGQLAIWGD